MIIFSALFFLLLSALFSGSELGYISANKLKVELKTRSEGKKARVFKKFFDDPQEFIASMLVGNNIALVIFTYVMTNLLSPLFSSWIAADLLLLLVITTCITLIVLVFGEYLPKVFFRIFGVDLLYGLTWPLHFIRILISIPSKITLLLSDRILRMFYNEPQEFAESILTRSELEQFIKTSDYEEDDSLETDMLQRALDMEETRVRDCMIPRTEIISIDLSDSIDNLKQLFAETRLSKILVYQEDIDQIMGYVHHQSMLDEPENIQSIMMSIKLVPEVKPVKDLMNLFIKEGSSIACVVDEFGGTSGIITLEDILEELFGEIEDEFDQGDEVEKRINEKEFLFAGRLEVDYINDKYENIEIPEGDYNTLSGFVIQELQEIPQEGQILETEDYVFIIFAVSEKKIELIKVVLKH